MKTLIKIVGTFFALLIVVLASISATSHARVAMVQHGTQQDINNMLVKHEEMKKQLPMTLIPEAKP